MRLAIIAVVLLVLARGPGFASGQSCLVAAKSYQPGPLTAQGTRQAVLIFAQFRDERLDRTPPAWVGGLFDPLRPGSIAHFYDTMSLGRLRLRGGVAPKRYTAAAPAAEYLALEGETLGAFGRFNREIIQQADRDIDFSFFDNDGPDGQPNSGDDDGFVDAVFVVTASTPEGFLSGAATGLASLGLGPDYLTDDLGIDGAPIRIAARLGSIQRGRSFNETVGIVCHEYGHVLGLPDLFDTEFFRLADPLPELDSAGIGRWGLMGWGASGWQGDDGPTSFCAWSRERLGWAQVMRVRQENETLRLAPVGTTGHVGRIGVANQEYFLLEYRRRDSQHYDRNIPAEGLLVWHIDDRRVQVRVDLECADGQWADAGFPLGTLAAPGLGEDNLDYWAHDHTYSTAHAGNLGDATDPFDGMRFVRFAKDTNPSALSVDGRNSITLEAIRLEGGEMVTEVTAPATVEVEEFRVVDADRDGTLLAGETGELLLRFTPASAAVTERLRLRLSSADSLVEVLQAQTEYRRVFGSTGFTLDGPVQTLRFKDGFSGIRDGVFTLQMDALERGVWTPLLQQEFVITALALQQDLVQIGVIDSLGNGDGQVQAGERLHLDLVVDVDRPALLRSIRFFLRSLEPEIERLDGPQLSFRRGFHYLNQTVRSPEFLVAGSLPAGRRLQFELAAQNGTAVWRDTLQVDLAAGPDRSPPQVLRVETRVGGQGLVFFLPFDMVWDGSPLGPAWVHIWKPDDSAPVAAIPLNRNKTGYTGIWTEGWPGQYAVQATVEDQAGNRGLGPVQSVVFPAPGDPVWPGAVRVHQAVEGVTTAEYGPGGEWLAVADGAWIYLYRGRRLTSAGILKGHQAVVRALAFAPQGGHLASAGEDGTVRLWDLEKTEEIAVLRGHEGRVTALAYDPVGRLASGGWDGTVILWDAAKRPGQRLRGTHDTRILALAYAPNGRILAAGTSDAAIYTWTGTDHRFQALEGHGGWVEALVFSPNGEWLASGSRDRSVRLWNTGSRFNGPLLSGHADWVQTLAFQPDGPWLASGGADGDLRFWDRTGFDAVSGPIRRTGAIKALKFSPAGGSLLVADAAGAVVVASDSSSHVPDGTPAALELYRPYPNPFNGRIAIPYRLTRVSDVRLSLYNAAGQLVWRRERPAQAPGYYFGPDQAFVWDGRTTAGKAVGSGHYFFLLEAAGRHLPGRILLVR